MPKIKITKRTVEALKVATKDYIAFDTDLPGFGVRVMPSGELTLASSPVDARRASIRMDLGQGDAREAIIANHSSGSEGRAARPCCDEKLQVTKT